MAASGLPSPPAGTVDARLPGLWSMQMNMTMDMMKGAMSSSEMPMKGMDPAMMQMAANFPLSRMAMFPGSPFTPETLANLVKAAN